MFHTKTFEDLLLEAIDDAFFSLGESAKTAIYFHLEKTFAINKKEIPNHLQGFSNALERIFGIGARHIEIQVMKNLNLKIDAQLKKVHPHFLDPDLTFEKYVSQKKANYNTFVNSSNFEVMTNGKERQK